MLLKLKICWKNAHNLNGRNIVFFGRKKSISGNLAPFKWILSVSMGIRAEDTLLSFPSREEILSSLDQSSCFESLPTPNAIKKSVARFFANQNEYPLGLYNGVNVILGAYQLNISDDDRDVAIKKITLALIDCCAKGKNGKKPWIYNQLRERVVPY